MDKLCLKESTLQYLLNADLDAACRTIALHTHRLPVNEWAAKRHPDVESIRKCRLLLENCPDIEEYFHTMVEVSPEWAAIVPGWPDLCAAMDKECPNWQYSLWANGAWQGQGTLLILKKLLNGQI